MFTRRHIRFTHPITGKYLNTYDSVTVFITRCKKHECKNSFLKMPYGCPMPLQLPMAGKNFITFKPVPNKPVKTGVIIAIFYSNMKKLLFILCFGCLAGAAVAQPSASVAESDVVRRHRTVDQVLKEAQTYEKRCNNNLLDLYVDTAGLKITRKDVAKLVDIVYSQQRCRCLLSPFSSYRPQYNEYSTLGGIAMDMIDAYRNGTKFPQGMWSCTKTDRTRADEIVQWWSREKEK